MLGKFAFALENSSTLVTVPVVVTLLPVREIL